MVAPTNVRFPERVHDALDTYTRRTGTHKSAIVSTAVSEWLRLQNHPRIHFVTPVSGIRRAALVDGPQVWSVAEAWLEYPESERTVPAVAAATGLRPDQVNSALSYWADNRNEIDTLIEQIHAAQSEEYAAWQRRQALNELT